MMANNSFLENFKSKVTYENKTTYAAAMIILGFLVWGITHEYSGLFTILLIMIPSILLVIPNALGDISALVQIFVYFYIKGKTKRNNNEDENRIES